MAVMLEDKTKIDLEVSIYNLCKKIGIPCKLSGYRYIKSAIIKISENEDLLYDLSSLYKEIGKDFNISYGRVERSMRHAIGKGFIYAPLNVINEIFGTAYSSETGKPTNGEFLGNLYEYLKYNK